MRTEDVHAPGTCPYCHETDPAKLRWSDPRATVHEQEVGGYEVGSWVYLLCETCGKSSRVPGEPGG